MLFTSWEFAFFLLVTFFVYYLPALRRFQVLILIAASLVFYACGSNVVIMVLLTTILFNAVISFWLSNPRKFDVRKLLLIGVFLNVAVLCSFKYGALILSTIATLWSDQGAWSLNLQHLVGALPLPLGISFFCFEGISLTVDSYKRVFKADTKFSESLKETALFICFFPHLISGPILRAGDFLPQISQKCFSDIDWYLASKWMTIGYFLKLFVANNLQGFTWHLLYPQFLYMSPVMDVFLLGAYCIQIFSDFAGYSYIALGMGYLFGYRIPVNFNAPFISRSLGEFWKRWNISLSSWLRDYVFIPIGGSRGSKLRACFNVVFIMTLGGLWHGAAWNYAAWGLMHGTGLVVEHVMRGGRQPSTHWLGIFGSILWVYSFVSAACILFILKSPEHLAEFLKHLAFGQGEYSLKEAAIAFLYIVPVVLLHGWSWLKESQSPRGNNFVLSPTAKAFALATMVFCCVVNPGPPSAFIYFQF